MDSDDEIALHSEAMPSPRLSGPNNSLTSTQHPTSRSMSHRRASSVDIDHDYPAPRPIAQVIPSNTARSSRSRNSISHPLPKPLTTQNRNNASIPHNLLPSAPASPPTPAPSPTPFQRAPSWTSAGENEDSFLRDARVHFSMLNTAERQRYLGELLNMCDSQILSFVHHFVSPRLKKDPFAYLPNELCLRVCN